MKPADPNSVLTGRALIRVAATSPEEDARGFLQGLVTNDMTQALPVYAGLLTPQGKTLFDFLIWPDGAGSLLIDCEADAVDDLVRRLTLYRLRRKITIERTDELAVHWRKEHDGDGLADPRFAPLGQRWIAPATPGPVADGADASWLSHRLSLGIAEGSAELGDILWLETNAAELNGVSFSKGCYVGQENTARMNWRQKINRRLVVVPLDRSDERRRKAAYKQLGLAVDHLRIDAIPLDLVPAWMRLEASDAAS